jgi:hypothetical protein
MPRKYFPVPAFVLLASLGAAPAAQGDDVRFEITPFVGYRMGGSFDAQDAAGNATGSADLDDGSSWGLDLGLYADQTGIYELLYSKQTSGLDRKDPLLGSVDVTTEYYQFGGTRFYPSEQWVVPYLSATIGATRFSADGYSSETKFSGTIGGGLRLPFNDNFAATLGVRGYLTFTESDTDYFCKSVNGEATCLLVSSGSTMFQTEALLGLTLRF